MEDNYVRKMSDEVDMEVDMNNDVRIDEDIHKDYDQETGKTVDCSKAFITTKVIILCLFFVCNSLKILYIGKLMLHVLYIGLCYLR